MKKKILALLLLITVSITGCSNHHVQSKRVETNKSTIADSDFVEVPTKETKTSIETIQKEIDNKKNNITETNAENEEVKTEDIKSFSKRTRTITKTLMKQSYKNTENNVFESGFSAYSALLMALQGSNGEVKEELEQMLGLEQNTAPVTVTESYKNLMQSMKTEDVIFTSDNSIWLNKDFTYNKDIDKNYIEPLNKNMDAQAKIVDISSGATKDEINKWCSDKTNGLIPEFLKQNLSENSVVELINAIYFLGTWDEPFETGDITHVDFNGTTKTSEIEFMNRTSDMKAYKNDKIKTVALPYKNGRYEMRMYLPVSEDEYIGDIFNSLSEAEIDKILYTDYGREEVKLLFPKFEIEHTSDIKKTLTDAGYSKIFDTSKNGFQTIGDDLYISNITQKAVCKVNENGTEAAAVTDVGMTFAMLAPEETEPFEFHADRPFIFTIYDTETDTIVFDGLINNL